MGRRVTSDLYARAPGRVAKNRARGRRPSALFLATRPGGECVQIGCYTTTHELIVL